MSSDATALSNQKQPAGPSKSWIRAALIWASLALVIGLTLFLLALWILGMNHGREFDAGNWRFQRFNFTCNPLTGRQFGPVERTPDFPIPPSITSLTSGGPLAPGTRWDLVEINKGSAYCAGPAQILLDYLSAYDQHNNYFWDAWTVGNPKAAPILWAAVRDCVHLSRYDRLPELFEAARSTTDPDKLKARLNHLMVDIAKDEANLQASLHNEEGERRAMILVAAYLDEKVETIRSELETLVIP